MGGSMNISKLYITAVSMAVVSLVLCCGCARKPVTAGGKVIARINNYDLTEEDFMRGAVYALPDRTLDPDNDVMKEQLLDELITQQVLLQEAQRQDFDKDAAFMKEIERYWEQALLKLLIKKKLREITLAIPPLEDEARQERIREEMSSWVSELRKRSDVRVYRENLKGVEIKR